MNEQHSKHSAIKPPTIDRTQIKKKWKNSLNFYGSTEKQTTTKNQIKLRQTERNFVYIQSDCNNE